MSVNKLILIGNLGGDPELKHTPSGQSVCQFSLATNETWKDKAGTKQERVEWTTIVAWGALGENCAKYLKKGRQVYVEGRKQTRTYEKDGTTKYFTECVAHEVQFLGDGKGKDDNQAPSSDRGRRDEGPPMGGAGHGADDDIPF